MRRDGLLRQANRVRPSTTPGEPCGPQFSPRTMTSSARRCASPTRSRPDRMAMLSRRQRSYPLIAPPASSPPATLSHHRGLSSGSWRSAGRIARCVPTALRRSRSMQGCAVTAATDTPNLTSNRSSPSCQTRQAHSPHGTDWRADLQSMRVIDHRRSRACQRERLRSVSSRERPPALS